jgi:2-isopropylmalate synthase
VFGEDAFRTATGVHAAAIAKAHKKGDAWLADRIYSGVPAGDFGLSQRIDVSHVSGISNVRSWLEAHGHDASDEPLCRYILDAAKKANHTLRDDELTALIAEHRARSVTA